MPSRRRQTNAHKVFAANLERSRAFLRIFDQDRTGGRSGGRPTNDEKELLRGSVVFAVGALDAYLSDLVLEIVPQHAPSSPHLVEGLRAIAKTDPSLSLRVSLVESAEDRRAMFRDALAEWLDTKSFHGPERLTQALQYVSCPIGWPAFDTATQRSTASELSRITDERHSIVHRGRKPNIVRSTAENAVTLVESIAALIDREVFNRYSE